MPCRCDDYSGPSKEDLEHYRTRLCQTQSLIHKLANKLNSYNIPLGELEDSVEREREELYNHKLEEYLAEHKLREYSLNFNKSNLENQIQQITRWGGIVPKELIQQLELLTNEKVSNYTKPSRQELLG